MFKTFLKIICFLLFATNSFAQQDGYWDKERTTNKEIIVSAGQKIIIKSEDFPTGTTEIVYRITLLDENQQMASSLVSVLKSIPDPTGISQGSAGAVFLLSKVSGSDKCKYGIFTTEKSANDYKTTGKTDKACLFQQTPINKEAKLLSVDKLTCLQPNTTNIFFGFESKNWVMNQKIILEIVPWVDNKLSRGWNLQNKQLIINQLKNSETAKKIAKSDDFCICQLEKLQEKFRFQEYQNLLLSEKTKINKDIGTICLKETGENATIENALRVEVLALASNKNYDQAITLLQENFINKGIATALDYNNIGSYYLFTKQYEKAIKNLKLGENLDNSESLIKLNLAHAYLFNNELKKAKEIHEKYKSQNVTTTQSWKSKTISDFENFAKLDLPSQNFKKILRIINQ